MAVTVLPGRRAGCSGSGAAADGDLNQPANDRSRKAPSSNHNADGKLESFQRMSQLQQTVHIPYRSCKAKGNAPVVQNAPSNAKNKMNNTLLNRKNAETEIFELENGRNQIRAQSNVKRRLLQMMENLETDSAASREEDEDGDEDEDEFDGEAKNEADYCDDEMRRDVEGYEFEMDCEYSEETGRENAGARAETGRDDEGEQIRAKLLNMINITLAKRRRKSRELAHDVQRALGAVRKKAIQDDGALVSAFVKLLAAETRKHRSWIGQQRTRAIGALHAQERNVQSILKQRESV